MNKRFLMIFTTIFCISLIGCGSTSTDVTEAEEIVDEESPEESEDIVVEAEEVTDDTNDDVVIEVIEGGVYSDEYLKAYEDGAIVGEYFAIDSEVMEYDIWQGAYHDIIENYGDGASYSLIYVNDDNIPELIIKTNDGTYIISTFSDGKLDLANIGFSFVSYIDGQNEVKAVTKIDAYTDEYVLAIKDGRWIQIALSEYGSLDIWAEDSFDENGNPIISYWQINGQELNSQAEYDEVMSKYFNEEDAIEITELADANTIIEKIDSL